MNRPNEEVGVIAVELGLCLPVLLMILLGGVHLARAVHARHRLSDAVSVAARTASVSGNTDQGTIAALVAQRLAQGQNGPLCDGSPVVTATQVGASPFSRLEVSANCNLAVVVSRPVSILLRVLTGFFNWRNLSAGA